MYQSLTEKCLYIKSLDVNSSEDESTNYVAICIIYLYAVDAIHRGRMVHVITTQCTAINHTSDVSLSGGVGGGGALVLFTGGGALVRY